MTPQGDQGQASKHLEEALKLDAEGYAHLFSIRMFNLDGSSELLCLSPSVTVTWQGYTWEAWPTNLTDYSQDTSGEMSRPKFTVGNPGGFFHPYVTQGKLDNCEVKRYRVLKSHLDANINSYLMNTWLVRRVVSLTPTMVVIELGAVVDGPMFIMPARTFSLPEFSTVSI